MCPAGLPVSTTWRFPKSARTKKYVLKNNEHFTILTINMLAILHRADEVPSFSHEARIKGARQKIKRRPTWYPLILPTSQRQDEKRVSAAGFLGKIIVLRYTWYTTSVFFHICILLGFSIAPLKAPLSWSRKWAVGCRDFFYLVDPCSSTGTQLLSFICCCLLHASCVKCHA